MRNIWSEMNKRRLWRRIWVALAEAEQAAGLVTAGTGGLICARIRTKSTLNAPHEIEEEIRHDLMAEVRAMLNSVRVGGGIIHLGATSMDVEDNADALRLRESLDVICESLRKLLLDNSRANRTRSRSRLHGLHASAAC